MKYIEKTMKPRKQELNKALVEAGHKIHQDKRNKRIARKMQERKREEYLYDNDFEQ